MENIKLVAKIIAMQKFAERTGEKIRELEFYRASNILSDSMNEAMQNDILERIEFTKATIEEIAATMGIEVKDSVIIWKD